MARLFGMARPCGRLLAMALTVLIAVAVAPAASLAPATIGQLVTVEVTELPRLAADRADWLGNGRDVVLGGWANWPADPVIATFPGLLPGLAANMPAASPRFALSPRREALAYWAPAPAGDVPAALLTLAGGPGPSRTLGVPVPVSPAMQLLWPEDGTVVYATETPGDHSGQLWAVDTTTGAHRQILSLPGASWLELRPGLEPGQVLALCTGAAAPAYAVNPATGQSLPLPGSARAWPAPEGNPRRLELATDGMLSLTASADAALVIDRGVRAAAWRPDGRAVLYVKDHEVWITDSAGAGRRLLLPATAPYADTYLRGCTWSPDGSAIVIWGATGSSGRAWKAILGTEAVTARFAFADSAGVKVGDRLWVVARYRVDALGQIVEPVWSTLKGVFTVTRVLPAAEGVIAEAVSSGAEPGVVDRVGGVAVPGDDDSGHIRIGLQGDMETSWTRTRTMKFREGLRAWLEKTPHDGEPLSLRLERNALPPIAAAGGGR